MRITICRGKTSLVRVEYRGQIGYFNAGRHTTDKRIERLANSRIALRSDKLADYEKPYKRSE